jgi:hypothetical protein
MASNGVKFSERHKFDSLNRTVYVLPPYGGAKKAPALNFVIQYFTLPIAVIKEQRKLSGSGIIGNGLVT